MPADNIEEVKLKTGESTIVKLKGLATAGYQWNYIIDDNKNLITVSKDFQLTQKTAGASADEVFTIKANNKGVVNINFFQKRSWETNAKVVNEKKVRIIIE